jgi:seryl-tRNA synthetase
MLLENSLKKDNQFKRGCQMLDPKCFREELEATASALLKRGFVLNVDRIRDLETQRKIWQVQVQELQNTRNVRSKEIGQLKARKEDASDLLKSMEALGTELSKAEAQLSTLQSELENYYAEVPNLTHSSVPEGKDETENRVERSWGTIPQFNFTVKDHVDLGAAKDRMNFDVAAKITGSRFVVLKAELARLQRALTQFMLDTHTEEHGYTEVYVPYLANRASLFGTGQLPKFEDDQFFTNSDQGYALIPTAEVPLTNLFRDTITPQQDLPIKLTAHTPCFRKEAGSYGRDMRGMIRQHQFEKVEMVQMVRPEDSYNALEELTGHAEAILKKLELPYRVMTLCSGDIGFGAAKTYDLEVWLPSQGKYREISSCSNFESFQARRLQARFRQNKDKPEFVHTLNGSGLAVGRTLVAILENYQQADGSIVIPTVLQSYLGGLKKIEV